MSFKKILLTGATGFLGSHIYNFLNPSYDVTTLGRDKHASIYCEFPKSIKSIDIKFDTVIHAAGKAHYIPKNDLEEKEFFEINYHGTKELCYALEGNIPDTFVFISTIGVYGKEIGNDIDENEPLNGISPYAKSKIMCEKFLEGWSKDNKVNLVILRLPLVAGRNPKGNLGAMIESIKKGYYFNIQPNPARKSIVLAEDVAKLIPRLESKNGIYNLSGEENYTMADIALIIAEQLNVKNVRSLPVGLVRIMARIGDYVPFSPINSEKFRKMTSELTISNQKAKEELDWNPSSLKLNFRI